MKKQIVAVSASVALLLAGCGGRPPNPVAQYLPGDEQRSCEGLKSEVANNEAEILRLLPDEDATGKNVVLGVAGAFLLVPWFFMDFKEAEATEIQALRRRNQSLREIAGTKGCAIPPPTVVFEEAPQDTAAPRGDQ